MPTKCSLCGSILEDFEVFTFSKIICVNGINFTLSTTLCGDCDRKFIETITGTIEALDGLEV